MSCHTYDSIPTGCGYLILKVRLVWSWLSLLLQVMARLLVFIHSVVTMFQLLPPLQELSKPLLIHLYSYSNVAAGVSGTR